MERSILKTVVLYLSIQLVFIVATYSTGNVTSGTIAAYAVITIIVHASLAAFLLRFREDFFNLSTSQPLTKINVANRITLLRISTLPSIALLLQHNEVFQIRFVLPALLVILFLTDSFDGQIARRGKQITRIGQMLDSISDYSLLGVISIVYFTNEILPGWFFAVILIRLFLQALGMFIFILLGRPLPMQSTWGGKITIATTMTLYVVEVLKFYTPSSTARAFIVAEYVAGAIIVAFSFEKAAIFFRQGKKVTDARKES